MPLTRPRRVRPFRCIEPYPPRDPGVPAALWELPRRLQEANDAGPRLSQTEIARRAGLSQSNLSRLAYCERLSRMQVSTLCRLAEAVDVSVGWLLGEVDTPVPAKATTGKPPAPAPPRKKRRKR